MALDQQVALKVLSSAVRALNDGGVSYWLTDGTLLGFYRENGFISHDSDIDLAVPINAYSDVIFKEMESQGFAFVRQLGAVGKGLELTFQKNAVNVDIFFFYREAGRLFHSAWLKDLEIRYYYEPFELKVTVFNGLVVNVPADTKSYLVQKYGPDWATPDNNWHWAFSPKNATHVDKGVWSRARFFWRLINHKRKQKRRKTPGEDDL